MAKLYPPHMMSKVQPELINQLHDEVLGLCKQKYSSVSGIEVDGIICISILDTREQQVVKIHKTLKSVFPPTTTNHNQTNPNPNKRSYPKIADILSSPSSAAAKATAAAALAVAASQASAKIGHGKKLQSEALDYKNDINYLSALLKANNEANFVNEIVAKEEEEKRLKTKRKRKPRKLKSGAQSLSGDNIDSNLAPVTTNGNIEKQPNTAHVAPIERSDNNMIIVKEEPIDPEFEAAENPNFQNTKNLADSPKIVSVHSIPKPDENVPNAEGTKEKAVKSVSNIIGSLIEKEIGQARDSSDLPTSLGLNKKAENNTGEPVTVKLENVSNDAEYGLKDVNQNSDVANFKEADNFDTDSYHPDNGAEPWESNNYIADLNKHAMANTNDTPLNMDMEKQLLYGMTKNPMDLPAPSNYSEGAQEDLSKVAMFNSYYSSNRPPREEKDPLGRSWLEMVKDNVNKYQAALKKTVVKVKGGSSEPITAEAADTSPSLKDPASGIKGQSFSLKSMLTEKPVQSPSGSGSESSEPWRGPGPRFANLTNKPVGSESEPSKSRSVTPTPVVKIEVDEDACQEMYPQSNTTDSKEFSSEAVKNPSLQMLLRSPAMDSSIAKPQGKLESKYPALFNQLQQVRGKETAEANSLVDRLPFISFQELFSQGAGVDGSGARLSDTATKQLLEQAKINPYPSKAPKQGKKRSVWKWKKRAVKPKDDDGHVLSHVPLQNDTEQESNANAVEQFGLGINMSARKTFSRKRQKLDNSAADYDSDQDYNPYEDEDIGNVPVSEFQETDVPHGKLTRLQSGEKPRMDFTELNNSDFESDDIEEIEMDQNVDNDPPMELVSAYCKNNCGHKFVSFVELKIHEETCCVSNAEIVGVGEMEEFGSQNQNQGQAVETDGNMDQGMSVDTGVILAGTNNGQFKCNLCGLDFNQEYRWHYHMVKSHGVASDKTELFR